MVLGLVPALSAVLKTALSRWANDLPVDPSFDRRELEQAFARS